MTGIPKGLQGISHINILPIFPNLVIQTGFEQLSGSIRWRVMAI